jgi:glycosyltransferase involved in cell wall biosynthesis
MDTSSVKVTIILTSYNHAGYLRDSIESVLNQTFGDFELIIWDDASTDNSWEIISSYTDPRIKSYRNEQNQRGGAIKRVINELARGEYIAIHHSDDFWETEKLEKQVHFLEQNPQYGAVFSHVQVIDENGSPFVNVNHPYYRIFDQPNRTRHEWLHYFFFHGNALCHPSILIRKECYQDSMYRTGLTQLTDLDMWVQLCLKHEIYIIQEKLVRFRVNSQETNTSGDRPETRIRENFEVLKVLENYKAIPSTSDLLKVFPDAGQYVTENNPNVLYALGRFSVDYGTRKQMILFGLNLLFDILNDPDQAPMLKQYQHFAKKEFVKLTARHDIFSNEEIRDLHKTLVEKEEEILFYSTSKSWRYTAPFRKLTQLLKKDKKPK